MSLPHIHSAGFYCQAADGSKKAVSHTNCAAADFEYNFSAMNAVFPKEVEDFTPWHCHGPTGYIRGCQSSADAGMINHAIGTSLEQGSAPEGPNTGVNYLVSLSCKEDVVKLNQHFCSDTERGEWFIPNAGFCGKALVLVQILM
jgi:hypothetical protein